MKKINDAINNNIKEDPVISRYIIYNIKTDNSYELTSSIDDLKKLMTCLIDAQDNDLEFINDQKFVDKCINRSSELVEDNLDDFVSEMNAPDLSAFF